MDYSRAIRVARALSDMPQRELAKRVSLDPSLISMLESGRRKPSLETLEKIAAALGIPFHLFTLLASEPQDVRNADAETVNRLAIGLAKLLLSGEEDDAEGERRSGRKAPDSVRESPRRHTQSPRRKTG